MISDEPDEDADNLCDETLLQTYLGAGDAKAPESNDTRELPDWPQRRGRDPGLAINAETLAWFKARHFDWQATMESVLGAWVVAQTSRDRMIDIAPTGSLVRPVVLSTQSASSQDTGA